MHEEMNNFQSTSGSKIASFFFFFFFPGRDVDRERQRFKVYLPLCVALPCLEKLSSF